MRLPPVGFHYATDTRRFQGAPIAQTDEDPGPITQPEPLQGREVHVIVVIVADDHRIDRGEVFEADADRNVPVRACEGNRTGSM